MFVFLGQMSLHIGESCKAAIADQIDPIMGHVETIDDIVTNGLREYEQVVTARCGQEVVAGPGEDRRTRRIGLDVVT